ncbi:MAG: Do family serine endopeptidase [Candidatus Poribacteria bacterium]|nr:Do family serine endopeptidase [Candidatus Poribacteria bacterium]
MFRLGTKFQIPVRVLLVLVALIVAAALVIDRGTDEFTLQTAIGQTNDTLEKSEDFLHLERANQAFIDLVAQTRPAVVQITTKMRQNRREEPRREQMSPEEEDQLRRFFGDEFFRRFFREQVPQDRNPEPLKGIGSGVIVSDDGYILTNNHVIEGTDEIKVTLANQKEYQAKLVGRDAAGTKVGGTDLALLKIDAEGLPMLRFGDSDALEVGEWVIAIGNPLNFSQTVTRGIVSAKGRTRFSGIQYGNFIQTDAPINRGNSGGALINIRGELVGINTLIATSGFTMGNIGLGFAVPSNTAQQVLPQLVKHGKVERAWLGISMENVNQELTEKLNFDAPRGAHVTAVGKGSPAEKGGIQPEDVIVEFNGEAVQDIYHLTLLVGAAEIGKSVDLTVLREGNREEQLTVKLEKRTEEVLTRLTEEQQEFFAGFQVQNLTPLYAEEYGYASDEKGVIVRGVERDSDAARQGIRPGSLVQEMEWRPIDDLETYSRLVNQLKQEKKEQVLFYVKSPHGQGGGYVTVKIPTPDR